VLTASPAEQVFTAIGLWQQYEKTKNPLVFAGKMGTRLWSKKKALEGLLSVRRPFKAL
jgi:hypothetical protein